ncbi:hypothetical protein [Amycolatopsis sp. NPDC098790]|uniref:hypothetical protein n=1 Tax=Amycolatopsis sp. NPDC098790 TaxID=3363939 RepID=UPI0038225858
MTASSGLPDRHRLNRGGDRQLTRRLAEGKPLREVKRCLERIIAGQLFRTLQQHPSTTPATP